MIARILLRLSVVILAVPLILAAIFLLERTLGYYPGEPGWSVARIAAEKNDVALCRRIIGVPWIGYLGPTTSESRMGCIYDYAKLTSDPSACELLMPGEYGLSCINNVIAQEYKDHPDSGFFDFGECKNEQKDPLRQDWCNFVRAHRSRKTSDCTGIQNNVIRTGCILKFDSWEKYPSLRGSSYFGRSAP